MKIIKDLLINPKTMIFDIFLYLIGFYFSLKYHDPFCLVGCIFGIFFGNLIIKISKTDKNKEERK